MPHLTKTKFVALLLLFACGEAPSRFAKTAFDPAPVGDSERGQTLLVRFQCNRCHELPGVDSPAADQNCVACHAEIAEGTFDAPSEVLARWQTRLAGSESALLEAPSLKSASRLDERWLAAFLREPFDLRPGLGPSMPRLAIDARDANDLASALAPPASGATLLGDAARGARLLRTSSCGACHLLGGEPLGLAPSRPEGVLAPDLIHARRLRPEILAQWIVDPRSLSPEARMPPSGLRLEDAQDIAAHLLTLERPSPPAPIARLPLLDREVDHEEVERDVFRRICWHCHSDPGYAHGDGGPGNHGGFGFEARGLDLSSYEGVSSGIRNLSTGRRESLFRTFVLPSGEEVPFLVAALLARRAEEAGAPILGVRGMPLGMPALPLEQIQLVESWIAQGYRR